MYSRIKSTKADDTTVAPTAPELQNGLQQAVARNYRIRQSHEDEMNKLLKVMDDERKVSAAGMRDLEAELSATQQQLQKTRGDNTELREAVGRLQNETRSLKAESDSAKKAADAARNKGANDVVQLKRQFQSELDSAVAQQVKQKLDAAKAELYEKQRQEYQKEKDAALAAAITQVRTDANSKLESVIQKTGMKAQKLGEAYENQMEVTTAGHNSQIVMYESTVAELKQANTELSAQLRVLSNTEDERAQAWKNHEATLMFELASARKITERNELQRDETERKLEKVIKESDTMRRVFEAALKEADSVASMLKEQLDMVRGSSREQALASDQEMQKQKDVLDNVKSQKSALELSKFKSEAELRDELHNLQLTAEQLQLGKQQLAADLAEKTEESRRSKDALGASIQEADILANELEAADKRCESIQREAEMRCAAMEAAKDKAIQEYKALAAAEKTRAHEAGTKLDLAEQQMRQAEMAVSRSKYELGTALQQNQKLRLEQEEAEVVMDLLDGQLADVRDARMALGGPVPGESLMQTRRVL